MTLCLFPTKTSLFFNSCAVTAIEVQLTMACLSSGKVEKGPLEDAEDQDEEEELKPPEQEVTLDTGTITEEEKQAIPEFFEGRLSKTPERYLKIRNYILDQW